jgi:hypothetical protein
MGYPAMRDPREILCGLVAADEAAGEAQLFVLTYTAQGPVILGHPGWPGDERPPSSVEVDDLAERGWVRIDTVNGKGRSFAITGAGREVATARARQRSAAAVSAVALDWSAVNPVLEIFYEAYVEAGAPEHGIESETVLRRTADPAGARAALRELVRGGYLDELADAEGVDIPLVVRPTTLALQLLAGWPGSSPEAALDELVVALDQAIASSADEDRRSKLVRVRDGLLGAARDVALVYFEKKVAG